MIRCSPRQKLGSLIGGCRINLFRGKGDDMSRFENFIQLSQGIIVRFTALYLLAGFISGLRDAHRRKLCGSPCRLSVAHGKRDIGRAGKLVFVAGADQF